jgi:hypothetical protein
MMDESSHQEDTPRMIPSKEKQKGHASEQIFVSH